MNIDHSGNLSRLLTELNRHYQARGFDRLALLWLRQTVVSGARKGDLQIENELIRFGCDIPKLLGFFSLPVPPPCEADLAGIQQIYAFEFGYRLPTPSDLMALTREPGPNNVALQEYAALLQGRCSPRVPVFAQTLIYRVNPDPPGDWYSAAEEDMNTVTAIKQFLVRANQHGIPTPAKVACVAHRHQMERCIRVLDSDFGIHAVPAPEQYDAYDPLECQPRVMSPEEYIVSDFVSMAALCLRRP